MKLSFFDFPDDMKASRPLDGLDFKNDMFVVQKVFNQANDLLPLVFSCFCHKMLLNVDFAAKLGKICWPTKFQPKHLTTFNYTFQQVMC